MGWSQWAWALVLAGGLAACATPPRVPPPVQPPAPDLAALFAKALAAQEADDPQAVAHWRALIALAPASAAPHINLGALHRRAGRVDEAIAEYETAIRLDPKAADAYHNLGLAHRLRGAWTDAERAYRRALDLRPDQAKTHYNLGVLYDLYLNRADAALPHYRRVVELGGPDAPLVAGWIRTIERRLAQRAETGEAP